MEDLLNIIKEIQGYKEFGFKPSDDAIMEASKSIFISNNIARGKNIEPKEKSSSPTSNQLWRLKKEGYDGDVKDLTKMEASKLIQEYENKKT